MKPALPLLLVFCAALRPAVGADATTPINAGQQNAQLAPGATNSDARLSPANAGNQLPFTRDDSVQNSRFPTPALIHEQMSPLGDQRASFSVTETNPKTIIDKKLFPKPKVIDRQMSPANDQMFYAQPKGDMVKKYGMVEKYQDGIANAHNVFGNQKVIFGKTTTFDKLNRFIFRRNGPENGDPLVTPAGGGATPQVSGGKQANATTIPAPPPPAPPSTAPGTAPST